MIDFNTSRNAAVAQSERIVIIKDEAGTLVEFIWDMNFDEVTCFDNGVIQGQPKSRGEAQHVITNMIGRGATVESGDLPFEIELVEQEVVEKEIEADELEQMLETASFTDRLSFGSVVVNFSWTHDAQVLVHMTEGKHALYPSTASAWVLWKSLVEIGFEVVGRRQFMNGA